MFEAFQFGPLLFRTQALFLFLGVWLGTELLLRNIDREGLRLGIFVRSSWWYLVAFFVGGRLFAVLLLYRVYLQSPWQIFVVWDGAFSAVGGALGIASVLFLRTRRSRESFLAWMDILMPSLTTLFAFDWIGRFLGAVGYGKPTDLFFGVELQSMHVRYTVPVHPVQLYYALCFFVLTILLLQIQARQRARHTPMLPGVPTLTGVFCSAIAVLFFEFFRGDYAIMLFATIWDVLFLGILFISLGVIAVLERRISHYYSLVNSALVGIGTVLYILFRSTIPTVSLEWRMSQFLAVLAMLATVVYVVAHRWNSRRSL